MPATVAGDGPRSTARKPAAVDGTPCYSSRVNEEMFTERAICRASVAILILRAMHRNISKVQYRLSAWHIVMVWMSCWHDDEMISVSKWIAAMKYDDGCYRRLKASLVMRWLYMRRHADDSWCGDRASCLLAVFFTPMTYENIESSWQRSLIFCRSVAARRDAGIGADWHYADELRDGNGLMVREIGATSFQASRNLRRKISLPKPISIKYHKVYSRASKYVREDIRGYWLKSSISTAGHAVECCTIYLSRRVLSRPGRNIGMKYDAERAYARNRRGNYDATRQYFQPEMGRDLIYGEHTKAVI